MPPVLTAAPAARPPSDAGRVQTAALLVDVPLPLDAVVVAGGLGTDTATAHRHLLALAADGLALAGEDDSYFRAASAGQRPAGAMDTHRRRMADLALAAATDRALAAVLTADPLTSRRARTAQSPFGDPESARQWLHTAEQHLAGLREHAVAVGAHRAHWVSTMALTAVPGRDAAGRVEAGRAALVAAAKDGSHSLLQARLHLARLLREAGDLTTSRSMALGCLRGTETADKVRVLYEMGAAEHAADDHHAALRTLRTAHQAARAEGDEAATATVMLLRGAAAAALGSTAVGVEYLTRARTVLLDGGYRLDAAQALAAHGRALMLSRHASVDAGAVLTEAAAELDAVGADLARARVLTWLADLAAANGDPAAARAHRQAAATARSGDRTIRRHTPDAATQPRPGQGASR